MRLTNFSLTYLDMQEPSPSEEDCDCSSTVADEIPSIHLQEINSTITSIKIDYDLFTSINCL